MQNNQGDDLSADFDVLVLLVELRAINERLTTVAETFVSNSSSLRADPRESY